MNIIKELYFFIKPGNIDFLAVSQSLAILNTDIEVSRNLFPNLNLELSLKMEDRLLETFKHKKSEVENSLAYIQAKEFLSQSVYPYLVNYKKQSSYRR